MLLQDDLEVGGTVTDFVILVKLATGQQNQDVREQVVTEGSKSCQGRDGRRPDGGVL